MKTSMIVGIVLIILGVAGLFYKNFSYTKEETVLEIGSLKATAEVEKNVTVPDALGIAAIIAGLVVIGIGRK
jgi:uncharacterized membrane protein